jgi:hypothetical protein
MAAKPKFQTYVAYGWEGTITLARSEKFRRDVGLAVDPICRLWGDQMRAWHPDPVRIQPDAILAQADTFLASW